MWKKVTTWERVASNVRCVVRHEGRANFSWHVESRETGAAEGGWASNADVAMGAASRAANSILLERQTS